tara:strand:- start:363 stop:704 length:342 start_codon:yes stop_codon:yes gene_type:complete
MNPDFHDTVDCTVYTMIHPDGDHTVAFHVYKNQVIIKSSMDPSIVTTLEEARKTWYNLLGKGYTLSNKSVMHDMKKFNRAKRREEKAALHHISDLQEMRVNPKDYYKNYALEA